MNRIVLAVLVVGIGAGTAAAQQVERVVQPAAARARPAFPAVVMPGAEGEARTPLHWRQVDVQADVQGWKLVHGADCLGTFASESEAREAQRLLQQLRCTERFQVGDPARPFTLFLVNGQLPRSLPLGTASLAFRLDELGVRGSGQDWFVCGREDSLFRAGSSFSAAWQALQTLRKYKADHICWIGNPDEPALRIPVREQ